MPSPSHPSPVPSRSDLDRRRFLQRLAAVGLLTVPGVAGLSACATAGGGGGQAAQGEVTADNPLGVDTAAALNVVIFDGGYGDEYALFHQELYNRTYPDADITHTATTQIAQEMQPRFVAGNPPDVLDNSGAQRIENATLVAEGQLTDLTPLLDAPSVDDPSVTVRDTLLPGVVEAGTYGDGVYALNYVYETFALWYDRPLFEQNGWTVPTTFDELFALCTDIAAAGISPFAYGGVNAADYLLDLTLGAAVKQSGEEIVRNIDNLAPGAWSGQEAVIEATTRLEEMARNGWFLPGSEALRHTEAQTSWVQGAAAFYVCGSWLENEMASISPDGFEMTAAPVPALTGGGALPATTLRTQANEAFVVPTRAANVNGGMEYLRRMLSREGAARFAELTASPPALRGATDGVPQTPALASVTAALDAAGSDVFSWSFRNWYAGFAQPVKTETTNLLAGRIDTTAYLAAMQAVADGIAADPNVTKYQR